MFDEISLKKIDAKYFNIILLDDKDITLQSRNTGHYWYLHCTEYPEEQSLIIFHKHFFRCPYHQHGKANTLNQAVRSIRRRLSERKISFEKLDSEESIRKWNRGELPVALIHPASAGHGLNLQSGGNILIWFGLTWSLELYQQTVARLWRQGQSAETVVVQHIITAGTIDEDVMKALANKDMTQNRLIAAVKARVIYGR